MANTITQSISSMQSKAQETSAPYTARASLGEDGSVDPTTSTVTGDRTSGIFTPKSNKLGKDDFMQLLIKQLQMQDPMSPMDNAQMMSQLSQLSSLESSTNMQKTLDDMKNAFMGSLDAQKGSTAAMTNAASMSLIGKTVRLQETAVEWSAKAGATMPIRVHLGNAASAEVEIVDQDGKVIRTLTTSGKDDLASSEVTWDGKEDDGTMASSGTYTLNIKGQDKNPELYAFVEDVVSGVRFTQQGSLVKVGGKELSVAQIMDVNPAEDGGFGAMTASSAVNLLGKSVRLKQESVYVMGKPNESVTLNLTTGSASSLTVRILDSTGNTVRILPVTADDNGNAQVVWNTRDMDDALQVSAGKYRISIDEARTDPNVYAFAEGTVDGLTTIDGVVKARINGSLVDLANILDVSTLDT